MFDLQWMVAKSVRAHFEAMGNHCLLIFAWESSFQGLFGGAGFCPFTVSPKIASLLLLAFTDVQVPGIQFSASFVSWVTTVTRVSCWPAFEARGGVGGPKRSQAAKD